VLSPSQILATGGTQNVRGVGMADWFGPLQPIKPVAPADTKPRQWEYAPGSNLVWTPRGEETISFAMLRNLADSYDLLRGVIETVKDQICKEAWSINVKPEPGEKKKDREKRQAQNPDVKTLTALFEAPDGDHDWPTWLRMVLEDMLVLDAPAVYIERAISGVTPTGKTMKAADNSTVPVVRAQQAGKVNALRPVDGATINRYITTQGFIPSPPSAAYCQTLYGSPAVDLTTADLVYAPRNPRTWKMYGYSPVEQMIVTVNIALRREMFQLHYYTDGSVPDAMTFTPPSWTPGQVKEFQDYWDSMLTGNLRTRRRMRFLPSFGESTAKPNIVFPKEALLKDEMDDWLAKLICYFFSVPSTPLQKAMNRASAQQNADDAEESGLDPKLIWVESMVNRIIRLLQYVGVEFAFSRHRETDALKQAQADNVYIGKVKRVNEVREDLGLDPDPNPLADQLGEYTPMNGFIPLGTQPAQQQAGADGEKPQADKPDDSKQMDRNRAEKTVRVHQVLEEVRSERTTRKLERAVASFLKNAGEQAASRVAAELGAKKAAKPLPLDDDETARLVNTAIVIPWEDLVPVVREPLIEAAQQGATSGLLSVHAVTGPLFSKSNQLAADFAAHRAAELVGKKLVDGALLDNPSAKWAIDETTREELRRTITQALSEETTVDELLDAIRESPAFSEQRARMIARTEVSLAQSNGTMAAWKTTGLVESLKWVLSSDHRCCDECDLNAAAGPVEFGKAFPSGDFTAPAHPNCNCAVIAAKVRY
jgi:hypothetical protein